MEDTVANGPVAALTRSRVHRRIAGVCGGLADYLRVDPTFVRVAWLILTIVPGAVLGGVLAYLLAWLVIPDAPAASPTASAASSTAPAVGLDAGPVAEARPLLRRSASNRRVAGVCGGLAEYFSLDATALRLLWVVLSVIPGAVIGGLLAYLAAWVLMPGPDRSRTAVQATVAA